MAKPIKFFDVMRLVFDCLWTYFHDLGERLLMKFLATFVK